MTTPILVLCGDAITHPTESRIRVQPVETSGHLSSVLFAVSDTPQPASQVPACGVPTEHENLTYQQAWRKRNPNYQRDYRKRNPAQTKALRRRHYENAKRRAFEKAIHQESR